MKFNVDINGVKYVGDGGFATEDTLAKLLKAYGTVNKTALKATKEADKALSGLADSASDAGDGLIEFDDAITDAGSATARAAGKLKDMGDQASDAASSLFSMGEGGLSLSGIVTKFGDIAGESIDGIAKLFPYAGESVGQLGKVAATTAVGLVALSISMIESYKDLNKEILNSGLVIQGGFEKFAGYAEHSGIPLQEFSSAMMANSKQLRLMSGGAPGGIRDMSKAIKEMGTATRSNLYSMGYSTEEIVSAMAEFSIQAQKSGKALTPTELSTRTASYLKSLTELSRLTGVSVKDAQAKADADRANLYVQANLLKVDEKYRVAASSFISGLNDAYAPMKDFVQTGEHMNSQSAIMAQTFPTIAKIMRETYAGIADGSMTLAQANASYAAKVAAGGDQMTKELNQMYETYGAAPADLYGSVVDGMGEAGVATQETIIAAFSKDMAAAGEVIDGSLQDIMGKFETTVQTTANTIQGTFMTGLKTMAPAIDAAITKIGDAAESVTDAKLAIEGFISNTDPNKNTELLNKISDVIGDGLVKGFDRVLGLIDPTYDYRKEQTNSKGQTVEGLGVVDSAMSRAIEWTLQNTVDTWSGWVNSIFVDPFLNLGGIGPMGEGDLSGYFKSVVTNPEGRMPISPELDTDAINKSLSESFQQSLEPGNALGGVLTGPNSGYPALLHGTEAVVPLPDGKSIPVDMSGFRTMLESALAPDSDPTEVANAMDELASTFSLDSSKIIDGSRTMPELLQINKALLQQYFALNEKFERMVKAMEDGNNINRSSAFARA